MLSLLFVSAIFFGYWSPVLQPKRLMEPNCFASHGRNEVVVVWNWVELGKTLLAGGFIFFIFIPIWGRCPIWLIFFKWFETTNQLGCLSSVGVNKPLYTNNFCINQMARKKVFFYWSTRQSGKIRWHIYSKHLISLSIGLVNIWRCVSKSCKSKNDWRWLIRKPFDFEGPQKIVKKKICVQQNLLATFGNLGMLRQRLMFPCQVERRQGSNVQVEFVSVSFSPIFTPKLLVKWGAQDS